MRGPSNFMGDALGGNYKLFSCVGQEKMLWEGMRNAQDIAFCADWTKFDPKMKKIGQLEFPEDAVDVDEPEEDFYCTCTHTRKEVKELLRFPNLLILRKSNRLIVSLRAKRKSAKKGKSV